MCVKLKSLLDREMKVYYAMYLSKVLKSKGHVLTTYLSLETQTHTYCKSM